MRRNPPNLPFAGNEARPARRRQGEGRLKLSGTNPKGSLTDPRRSASMTQARPATSEEISRILSESPLEVERLIDVHPVQLSQPLGGGPRIKVSVRRGQKHAVPPTVDMRVNHHCIRLRLEACEDYQDYRPL